MARNFLSTPSPEEIDIAKDVANLSLDTTDLWIEAFGKAFADENIWYLFNLFFSFDNKKRFSVNYASHELRKRYEIHEKKMKSLFNTCVENKYLLIETEEDGIYYLSSYFFDRKEVFFRKSSNELLILYNNLSDRKIEIKPLPTGYDYSKAVMGFWVNFEELWRDALEQMLKMESYADSVVPQYLPKAMEATAWYTVMLVWSRDYEIKTIRKEEHISKNEIEKKLFDNFNCDKNKINEVLEFLEKIDIIKPINNDNNKKINTYSLDINAWNKITFVFVDLSLKLDNTKKQLMKIIGNKIISVDFNNKVLKN